MNASFGGVWPAMLTPFTEEGEPNLDVIDPLVDAFAREGLDGLYVLGSTGQGLAQSVEQRRRVLERVVTASRGRLPVMVHVGAIATRDAVELARHAADCGADAVSSVPPVYFPCTQDAVFEHYRQIGGATELPFFPYHLDFFGVEMLADPAYTQRVLAIPNVAGMKLTIRDLYHFGLFAARTRGRLTLFSGADELVCHAVLSGAVGAIGTFYNLWGRAVAAARCACTSGDVDRAREFMETFQLAVDEILRSGNTYDFLRRAMRLKYDIDIGPGRSPSSFTSRPWDDAVVERIVARVDATLTQTKPHNQ